MISCVVPGSARAFNFKERFHLTEEEVNTLQAQLQTPRMHARTNLSSLRFLRLWR